MQQSLNEPKARLPQVTAPPLAPRFVVLDASDSLPRLLHRYLSKVQVSVAKTLAEVRSELAKSTAQLLLINGPADVLDVQNLPELEKGIPVIACPLPGVADQAQTMDVASILVKPIARARLLELLGDLGIREGIVLIVDDDPDALQLFTRMLTSSELAYRILAARDGQEALNILQDCRPTVILLDLIMPNLSGFQFLERRAGQPWHDVPVIVISTRDPAGHPVVSQSLWVTQKDGFSARQLLHCIQVISQALAVTPPSGAPELPAEPTG